jgi:hypothetical protein
VPSDQILIEFAFPEHEHSFSMLSLDGCTIRVANHVSCYPVQLESENQASPAILPRGWTPLVALVSPFDLIKISRRLTLRSSYLVTFAYFDDRRHTVVLSAIHRGCGGAMSLVKQARTLLVEPIRDTRLIGPVVMVIDAPDESGADDGKPDATREVLVRAIVEDFHQSLDH